MVLGRDPVPGQPPDDPDNRTLVALLLLRQLEEAAGRELPVVTELIDDRNRALVPISPGADVIISGKLIGLLMSQISPEPAPGRGVRGTVLRRRCRGPPAAGD
jgi:hypothetical protein